MKSMAVSSGNPALDTGSAGPRPAPAGWFSPARIGLAVRLGIALLVTGLVLRFMWTYGTVKVPDWNDQMAPALPPGGRVLVCRAARRARDLARGEMVAYAVRGADGVSVRFGRVAALPGDKVEIRPRAGGPGEEVLVNGEPVPWGPELVLPASPAGERSDELEPRTEVVPENALFLLNDRRFSRVADSRRLGPIPQEAFAGKVVMAW